MTKVHLSSYFFSHQTETTQLVRKVVRETYIAGIRKVFGEDPVLAQAHLLSPPRIECIDLTSYEGRVNDMILVFIATDFGLASLRLSITDEHGSLVENGAAGYLADNPTLWHYMTTVPLPSDATVIVSITATDVLGGVGRLCKRITLNEELLDILRGEYL